MIKKEPIKHIEASTFYNQNTYANANDAVLWLNKYSFEYGKSVVLRYYVTDTEGHQEIEEMTAVGIKTGSGYDAYRIINVKGRNIVSDILEVTEISQRTLPDVTELVHGEVMVVYNKVNYKYYYAYHSNPFGTGMVLTQEITRRTQVTCLSDGITYLLEPGCPLNVYSKLLELEEKLDGASNLEIEELKNRLQAIEENYVKVSYLTENDYLVETGGNVNFEDNILYLLKGDATYNDVNQVCVVGGYWQGHPFKFCKDAKWVIDSKDPWAVVLNVLLGSVGLQTDTSGNFTGTILNGGKSGNKTTLGVSIESGDTRSVYWKDNASGEVKTTFEQIQIKDVKVASGLSEDETPTFSNGKLTIPAYWGTSPRLITLEVTYESGEAGSSVWEDNNDISQEIQITQNPSHYFDKPSEFTLGPDAHTKEVTLTYSSNLELTLGTPSTGMTASWKDETTKKVVKLECERNIFPFDDPHTVEVIDSIFEDNQTIICNHKAATYTISVSEASGKKTISDGDKVKLRVSVSSNHTTDKIYPGSSNYPFADDWNAFELKSGSSVIDDLGSWTPASDGSYVEKEFELPALLITEVTDNQSYTFTVAPKAGFSFKGEHSDKTEGKTASISAANLVLKGSTTIPDFYCGYLYVDDSSILMNQYNSSYTSFSDYLKSHIGNILEKESPLEINDSYTYEGEEQPVTGKILFSRYQSPILNSEGKSDQFTVTATKELDDYGIGVFFALIPTNQLSKSHPVLADALGNLREFTDNPNSYESKSSEFDDNYKLYSLQITTILSLNSTDISILFSNKTV